MNHQKQLLKYLISLLIFGMNGIVASYIAMTSEQIVLSRTIIGGALLVILFFATRQQIHKDAIRRQWPLLLLSGAAMGLSWVFLFGAYRLSSVSTATLLYYCGPVFVLLLAPVLFHEKLTAQHGVGIVVVLFGMFLVNGVGASFSGVSLGFVYGVLSALLYAVMILACKHVAGIAGLERTTIQILVACVVVAVYNLVTDQPAVTWNTASIIATVVLGVVNTGAACYLYFSSIPELPAQTVAVCSYLDPLSALVFSALFLSERMSLPQVAGAVCILGGAAFAELYQGKKRRDAV